MRQHDADLCERIRKLEERVRELEARPPVYQPYPYYVPWTPPYWTNPYYPTWSGTSITTDPTSTITGTGTGQSTYTVQG